MTQTTHIDDNTWPSDSVFGIPSRVNDDRNTWRIAICDETGRIIAEFYGANAKVMADHFCKMFGEQKSPDGS